MDERCASGEPEALAAAHDFIRRICAFYSVKAAILFGSRARGTHRPDSDVDLAILLHGPTGAENLE